MKLKALATAILATTFGVSAARPGFSQTDLNAQLRQDICTQNWSRAIQVVDQMKKVASPEYASQLTMYRGRLEAMGSSGARVPSADLNCSASSTAIAANTTVGNTNTSLSAKDQAFITNYKRLAASRQDTTVRELLLNSSQQSPKKKVEIAKSLCEALRAGTSWDKAYKLEAQGIIDSGSLNRKAKIENVAIITTLAPTYYCPEFVGTR